MNTRNENRVPTPIANLSCFQKNRLVASILPCRKVSINKRFNSIPRIYLYTHSFYSISEISDV